MSYKKQYKFDFIEEELNLRREKGLLRRLKSCERLQGALVRVDGQEMIDFSSNDYLGLASDSRLFERSVEFSRRYGNGSTASRLVCGNHPAYDLVEKKTADLKRMPRALIFNTGYQANITIIPALTDKDSVIFSDRLNHNSLIQGALLSRCKVEIYDHNDINDLKDRLKAYDSDPHRRKLILTESVFSMDGDQSDIDQLAATAQEFNAILYVDEAHATGVLGENGMGLCVGKNIDFVMGTFGKALGCFGAYLACSDQAALYLINKCAGLIYTTGLPPSALGAIDAALDLASGMEEQRRELQTKAEFLRHELKGQGFDTGQSTTQILPVMIGGEKEALNLGSWLFDHGIMAIPIRPPTVEPGKARIRLTVSVAHQPEHLDKLLDLMGRWKKKS